MILYITMAKLIFNTPHLFQLCESVNSIPSVDKPIYMYNDEAFTAQVEKGTLIVKGKEENHMYVNIDNVSFYDSANLSCHIQSVQLPDVNVMEYDIDDEVLEAKCIKYRFIEPVGFIDLSEIEYKGKKYKGKPNSISNLHKEEFENP